MVSALNWFASLFEAHKSQSRSSFQFRDLQKKKRLFLPFAAKRW